MTKLISALFALFASWALQAQNIQFDIVPAACGNPTGVVLAGMVGGAPPFTYVWSPTPPNGQGTDRIDGLAAGTYTLTATDYNGSSVTATAEVLATTELFPPFTPPDPIWACVDCGGNPFLPVPFNMPLAHYISFEPQGPAGFPNPVGISMNNLCPGQYTLTVMDVFGCIGIIDPMMVLPAEIPMIIGSTITGSCPGGATGSMSLDFNQVDSVWVSGPDGLLPYPTSNPYVADHLPAGNYVVMGFTTGGLGGFGGPLCDFVFTVVVPISTEPCGTISGLLYADIDSDCDQAPIDLGIPHQVLNINPGDHYILTDANGAYSTGLPYDSYVLNAPLDGYESNCTTLPAAFELNAAASSATIDIPMDVLNGPDVRGFVAAWVHRVGFPVSYTASMHSESPFPFSGLSLDLFFDPVLTFVSSTGSPTLVAPGQLRWDVASLPGYGVESFEVEFIVPASIALLGTVLSSTATVNTQTPDSEPGNDSYTIHRNVIGSYDPNDKQARTDIGRNSDVYLLDQDHHVDYTIRFQNTGSAEAINVFLLDTISSDFDLSSLRVLGTSHPFEVSLLPGRVLRFDFTNIMLPDSTSDLLGSQGFASFRLVPMPGLELGDHLLNAADIFFDFNEPIRTNTSDLVAEFSVGIAEGTKAEWRVYPNPVRDALMVQVPDGTWSYEVISMDGRVAARGQQSGTLLSLDASGLASGSYILRLVDGNSQVLNTRFAKH